MEGPEKSGSTLAGLKAVSLLTLVSRITGLARDALMASLFGTGWVLDAFTVAFRVPNMFRRLFGEGAVTAALLPEFVAVDQTHGRQAAADLFAEVAYRLIRILGTTILAIEAVLLLAWLFGNLTERNQVLCELAILMMPYAVLICIAATLSAGLNAVQHFVIPALVPVALNIVWLIGGLLAAWLIDVDVHEARTIAVCILLGGIVQLLLSQAWARRFGLRIRWRPSPDADADSAERATAVFRAMMPVLLGLSIMQINTLVDSALAWLLVPETSGLKAESLRHFRLPEGCASALYLGQRLFQFPMGVFGIALSTVLFPRFARHAREGDTQLLTRDILHGLQLVTVVGIPASAGLCFMAEPITSLLFRHGQFSAADAILTSRMIAAHGVGVWIFCALLIVNRVFYATGDRHTPMRQGLTCVGMNLVFSFALIPLCGGPALALASVIATLFQLGLALEVLRRRAYLSRCRRHLSAILWRSLPGTALMTAAGMGTLAWLDQSESVGDDIVSRGLLVAGPMAVAVAVYLVTLVVGGVSPKRLLREPFGSD
ncbi:MAG: murein biosynthesis integral membrane protein MurJ [Planctomycetaceae bacterium]